MAGVSENSVRYWIEKKRVPTAEHEGHVGLPLKELTAFLEARPVRKYSSPPGPKPGKAKAAGKAKPAANGVPGPSGFLAVPEAAALAGVSTSCVLAWAREGKFPVKKGKHQRAAVRFPRKAFDRFLEKYLAAGGNRRAAASEGASAPAPAARQANGADDLLTTREAANQARVTTGTIYKWIGAKLFPAVKQGHSTRILRAPFVAYLATYGGNPKAPREDAQHSLPFDAIRALARGEEREAEFGGRAPRADALASLDMAEQIGNELGAALGNYRKHVLRKFLTEQLAKLDAER